MSRPYVLLSAAVSLDGYLDDTGPDRLLLSGPADFDRVDAVRASADAVLVGAGTIRADNPRLLVASPVRRSARVSAGRPEHPLKVTVSGSGELDVQARFWHTGGARGDGLAGAGHVRPGHGRQRAADGPRRAGCDPAGTEGTGHGTEPPPGGLNRGHGRRPAVRRDPSPVPGTCRLHGDRPGAPGRGRRLRVDSARRLDRTLHIAVTGLLSLA
ncbi:hypothetical protein GCM10010129_80430 [Streptomyces fumigatiscleroticus]|nr:hypothetical protein GCM10010129_80430 [Streptomyces fumigatiscleroticus]